MLSLEKMYTLVLEHHFRGDWGQLNVGNGCNVGTIVFYIFPGKDVILEENAHIGHGAIVHGAHIGKNSLVGMNAVIMDDVVIGKSALLVLSAS